MAYSGPRIKLRANVRIPARTVEGPGISNVIANGTQTIGLDITPLDVAASIPDPTAYQIPIYNPTLDEWEKTPLSNVPTTTTGDARTGHGDSAYLIPSTDRYIALTAALTAPRVWTLPAANAVSGGTRIVFHDEFGGLSSTNTLTFGVTGADTINGAATIGLNAARSGIEFRSDGTSKWSVGLITTPLLEDAAVTTAKIADTAVTTAKVADTAITTAKVADKAVTLAKQADIATASVIGRKTAGTGVPEALSGSDVRDNVTPAGALIDTAYASYATSAAVTAIIPFDNTTPQNTEGTQILSASITPKSTTNKVRVRVVVVVAVSATDNVIVSLFRNSTANALRSSAITLPTNYTGIVEIVYEDVPASTSAQTYNVRVGPGTAAAAYLNYNGITSNLLGSFGIGCTLTLDEYKA